MPNVLDNPVDRQILKELSERNQKHVERADESYMDLGTIKVFNVDEDLPNLRQCRADRDWCGHRMSPLR